MSIFLRLIFLAYFLIGCSQEESKQQVVTDLKIPKTAGHFFVLHRFNDNEHKSTSITNDNLIKHFNYLKKHNYYTATLDEIITKMKNREDIPDNWVHFCIDDSYKSFYANGLPLFKKYKIPFTIYIYVEATQRHYKDFMSWDQIKETMKYGSIGVHSFGHKHMTHMTPKEMKEDTQKALVLLEKNLGFKPTTYAYPYGEYDKTLFDVIKSFNFDLILNQNQGAFSKKSPADDLDRIALTGDVSIKQKLRIKYLPAKWTKVNVDRKTNTLKSISLEIDPSIKSVECYVTGDTWHRLKPKNGKITKIFNIKLKKSRSRIIIKTPGNAWTSQIIVL